MTWARLLSLGFVLAVVIVFWVHLTPGPIPRRVVRTWKCSEWAAATCSQTAASPTGPWWHWRDTALDCALSTCFIALGTRHALYQASTFCWEVSGCLWVCVCSHRITKKGILALYQAAKDLEVRAFGAVPRDVCSERDLIVLPPPNV